MGKLILLFEQEIRRAIGRDAKVAEARARAKRIPPRGIFSDGRMAIGGADRSIPTGDRDGASEREDDGAGPEEA